MTYFLTFIVYTIVDLIWFFFVAKQTYLKDLPFRKLGTTDNILLIILYLILSLGLYFLVIKNGLGDTLKPTLLKAFIFGFSVYATYNITNYLLFDNWSITSLGVDSIWGGVSALITTAIIFAIL